MIPRQSDGRLPLNTRGILFHLRLFEPALVWGRISV